MTGTIRSDRSSTPRSPRARLRFALVASAFAHGMLVSVQLPNLRWPGVAPGPAGMPITVRLAPVPNPAPDSSITPEPETRRPPSVPSAADSEGSPNVRPMSAKMGAATEAVGLPGPPDPNYYLAHELDDYPRPFAPLRIDQPPGFSAGEMRLELLIDEHGVVRDITFSGSAERGGAHEALRGALMATPFVPAVKDGRAVRSRIVLSVGFPTASGR